MGAIQLSYSTFGLTNLGFLDAIDAVDRAGYDGVEVSFHRDQFNPFDLDDAFLGRVKQYLDAHRVNAACVATASHFFTPQRPHEPSLLALEQAGRKRRIDLIKRGIRVARQLEVPLVTFGSGFVRDDHVAHPQVNVVELLVDSIHECLREIRDDEDITLLIEPEPGMLIETHEQALALIRDVGSTKFQLHIDLCHAYCSEPNYIDALAKAAPFARYLHLSDACAGYNLKIVNDGGEFPLDMQCASTLVHFPDTADYLLLDRAHPIHFREDAPNPARVRRIEALMQRAGIQHDLQVVEYVSLYAGSTQFDNELLTYLISVPGLSYDVLERAKPVLSYLRGAASPPLVGKMIANTQTGIVHFHEIPGKGTLDFAASFKALTDHGFTGYGSVELYHHVASWQQALTESHRHLAQFVDAT